MFLPYKKKPAISNQPNTNLKEKGYASHRVCNADANAKDPKTLKNNPIIVTKSGKSIQHMEITRQECDQDPNCKDKVCPTICGNIKDEESVGHLTGGNVNNTQGHTVNLGNTDINGNTKPQNAYMYNNPHKTSPNQNEVIDGTTYVKQPSIESIIKKVESK